MFKLDLLCENYEDNEDHILVPVRSFSDVMIQDIVVELTNNSDQVYADGKVYLIEDISVDKDYNGNVTVKLIKKNT